MNRPPQGVQQIFTFAGITTLVPVLPANWKYFCLKSDADALAAAISQQLGIAGLQVVEDGEEQSRYVFSGDGGPRVYSIIGQDKDGNQIYESAGWLLDRRTSPQSGIDRGPLGDTARIQIEALYGYAQLIWTA